ncbi:hypothetical protein EJB05_56337, partial [Eragrostis curvula]
MQGEIKAMLKITVRAWRKIGPKGRTCALLCRHSSQLKMKQALRLAAGLSRTLDDSTGPSHFAAYPMFTTSEAFLYTPGSTRPAVRSAPPPRRTYIAPPQQLEVKTNDEEPMGRHGPKIEKITPISKSHNRVVVLNH